MRKKSFSRFSFLLMVSLIVSLAGACAPASPPSPPTSTVTQAVTPSPTPTAAPATAPTATPTATEPSPREPTPASLESSELVFASFRRPAVESVPAVYHEAIAPDLSNVQIPFILSQAQLDRLAQNGFVVSPGNEKEFFTLYEKARYDNVPIFVTTDSLLHTYHLLFDKVLRTAEVEYFIPLLRDLNQAMLARTDELYQHLRTTDWEEAARRAVAFTGVGSKLLAPDVQVPQYAAVLVEDELALIEEAGGMFPSPIFPGLDYGEDYTQYIPRGHYTKSDDLKAYFKSMMWYGRMTFRLMKTSRPDEVGRRETRSALLLVHALRTAEVDGDPALETWADLYSPTVFFVGRSDDLTVLQYGEVMDAIYGEQITVDELTDDALLEAFAEEAKKLPPPRILGMVIMDTDDIEETTKGMRFMGQRFVPDAYIFGQLIYRNVSTREHRRGLPNGLDIPAAMGSERAYQILDDMGETTYENYPQQMEKARGWLSGLSVEEWTETLYNAWLYSFRPLLEVPGDGYPAFMRSQAWVDKQLNTVLGSWAELKHDTILYAKQVYAELGGGPPPPPPVAPKGYVEPVPEFYARLAALTDMTREGLGSRGLLSEQDENSLQRMSNLAQSMQVIAEKELRGEPLTEEEYETIRFYGGELEHLTMAAADTEDTEGGVGGEAMPGEEPEAAVIADVATDPEPQLVLEVAVGRINEIHVVVPLVEKDGTIMLQVAKGGTFSYYEFPWPMGDRLTDETWRQMLEQGEAPPPPPWIDSFFTEEGEHSALQEGIYRFQESLVKAFWYLDLGYLSGSGETQAQLRTEIEQMQAEKRYQARTLMGSHFRSFDRQSEALAVVTAQETWKDTLYEYEDDWPTYYEDPVAAQRGPYTLDVTYTLERRAGQEDRWEVTRVIYANEPPEWQ